MAALVLISPLKDALCVGRGTRGNEAQNHVFYLIWPVSAAKAH